MELESIANRLARLYSSDKPTWYDRNKAAVIERKYGITLKFAQEQLEKQQFLCAVCSCHLDLTIGRNAQIEHDHTTNKFRGIVCLRCNLAIGWIGDDPERARKLIAYLERAV